MFRSKGHLLEALPYHLEEGQGQGGWDADLMLPISAILYSTTTGSSFDM